MVEIPSTFVEKYEKLLGEEAPDFLEELRSGQVKKGFRYNPLKPDARALVEKQYPAAPAPYAKTGFLGEISGKHFLHQAGYIYSQEPSAMIVGEVVDAQPGEKILDLCAAPGGKSTQIASQLQGQGLLVANEIFPKRAKILSENLERWGARNSVVTNHAPAELVPHFSGYFDRILVDAPCSGEGMFRKEPEARAQWTSDLPISCAKRQKEILASAVKMLKTGGTLIYSTCTFAPEENEEIISWLVENYPLELAEIPMPNVSYGRLEWGSVADLDKTVRLWPHKNQGEGHFVAKLIFHGENPTKKAQKSKRKPRIDKEQQQAWQSFHQQFPLASSEEILAFGAQLWAVPAGLDVAGLKVIRPGLHLGTVKKNRFEPSFALAMAYQAEDWPALEITEEAWKKYVAGETFAAAGSTGWVLLKRAGAAVGFGKHVQGVVKNFYPKGLRFRPE